MNASVRPPASPVETSLAESFEALRASGASPAQEAAFARFAANGLPSRRIEAWHYTDLRTLLKSAPPPSQAVAPARAGGASPLALGKGRDLVFVGGSLTGAPALPPGVSIERSTIGRTLASPVIDEADASVALTRAFAREAIMIRVDANVSAGALHLAFHNDAAATSAAHVIVSLAPGASLTLIESHDSAAGAAHLAQALVEFDLGEGASASHVRVNALAAEASSVSTLGVDMGAHAKFETFSLTMGAGVSRHQVFLRFSGDHANAAIRGATLARGRQHADTTLVVNHVAPHCESRETFKSIIDEDATGVFQGRINVAPAAQKTDARMSSNALLLSEGAAMYNKPELEIFADDVQCAHGATCGELDEDLLFYIMARGIPRHDAEALLLEAFVAPAFEGVADETLRETLMERVRGWLAQRKS
ncbi:MAG: Fe-S cluster assembly protein SufD [Beijerinckiaceae bacterium]|nr:Fe-S cluster assembly protein SufD [Beijerinckiaceae bacterium]